MSKYSGPLIDVDVHQRWARDAELLEYMPPDWDAYVRGNGREQLPLYPPGSDAAPIPFDSRRADTFPADGTMAGSSYELLRTQLLDRYGYTRALLVHDVGQFATHLNPYFATALCQAVNDWNIDTWLRLDERFYSVVVTPIGRPEEAAKEIRRIGSNDRIVAALIAGNPLGRPIGDPVFHPFWEAAAEMDLAVTVHVIRADRPGPQMGSVGAPKARIEGASQLAQQAMHYVASLIVHGIFEKFPDMQVVMTEFGVDWVPYVVFRLDQHYRELQYESPWVKKWPSEYILEHIKVSTQPIEDSPERKGAIADLLGAVDGIEDVLCFASDYPHYSMDDPLYVSRLLPSAWHSKLFYENACTAYGWPVGEAIAPTSSAMR